MSINHAITAGAPAPTAPLVRLRLFQAGLRAHWPFFALTGLYIVLSALALRHVPGATGSAFSLSALHFVAMSLLTMLLAIVTLRFLRLAVHERPARPALALIQDLRTYLSSPARLANGLPMVLAMLLFMRCFAQVKVNIPHMAPFAWDQRFMEWDRWLHLGHHPWELLQPLLGYPLITFLINIAYHLWFIVMWGVWCWLAFAERNSGLRIRFFMAFMLTWSIGGSLMATLLSSAGPCYYGLLGLGDDPFAPLMAYLHGAGALFPLWALDVQQLLWDGYAGETGKSLGISAMPSMHNASALLFALVGWRVSRSAGIGLSLFCGLVLLGSVHLGWHYAIDGYVGFAIAWGAWWIAGPMTRWYLKRPSVRAYNRALGAVSLAPAR